MAVDVGSAVGYLDLDISGFLAGLKSAQNEADKQSKNIATKIGNNFQSAGKKLTSVGTALTTKVTAPLVAAGTAAFKFSSDFESAMAQVKTIADPAAKSIGVIKDEIVDLSNKTGMAASDLAAATYQAISAGVNTASSVEFVATASKLATAGFSDTTTAVDALTTIINAYGMSAKDATHISDVLISTQNKGKTTVNELASTMGKVIPTANAMGVSLEDLGVAYSYLTAGGIATAESTTYLNGMFNELGKSGTTVSDVLKERTGMGFQELMKSGKSLREVLEILVIEAQETGVGFNDLWGSQEAGKAALALLNTSTEDYNETLKDFQTTIGDTETAYGIMAETTEYKLNVALQNGKNALIQVGDTLRAMLLPFIEKGITMLKNLNDWLVSLSEEEKKQVIKFAAIVAAAGPVLVIFGKLVIGVGSFITTIGKIPAAVDKLKIGMTGLTNGLKNIGEGFTAAKAGFGGLATQAGGLGTKIGVAAAGVTGPMIAIAAVVAIVIAAFVSLWKNNEEFRNKVTAIWDQIKATFEKLTSGIVERLNKLGFDFSSITDVIKTIWEGFCNFLAPIFEGVFQHIANTFDTIVNIILGVVDFFVSVFTGDWEGCWTAVKTIFESIWNGIKDWFSNILNIIKGMLDVVLGWFGTSWSECWESIKTFFINIWTSITSFLSTAWETIKNVIQVGIMFIVELIKAAFNLITLPFQFIWQNCKEYVIGFVEDIKKKFLQWRDDMIEHFELVRMDISEKLQAIKDFFSTIWNAIKTAITNVLNSIKTSISNVFNSIKTTVANIWNGIKDAISGPLNTAKTTVSNVINSIKSYISTGLNSAKNTVTNTFNSIKTTINNIMNSAKTIVQNAINSIKSKFNFSWSLPKLKLPHPRITGSFSLNPPSVPSFSIEWYKKAMGNGMVLDTATIFGFNSKTGKFLAGGEAGSEVVVGTKSLLSMIKQAVYDAVGPLVLASHELAKASAELGYVTYNGFTKFKETKERQKGINPPNDGDGDTFIFYSPKSIDEVEAARQMKKTKRELAEGF